MVFISVNVEIGSCSVYIKSTLKYKVNEYFLDFEKNINGVIWILNGITFNLFPFLRIIYYPSMQPIELFFTFLVDKKHEVTSALRFENEVWREVLRQLVRCEG